MLDYDPHMPPEGEDLTLIKTFDLIDLDQLFYNNPDARVINNENLISREFSKEFTDAIFQNCDGELGFVPTCLCGAVTGVTKEGLVCPKCGTKCSSGFIDVLQHNTWIAVPKQMPAVMHPIWYMIMKNWTMMGRKYESLLDILLNPEMEIPDDFVQYIHAGECRGFDYVQKYRDELLDILINKYDRTAKKATSQWMKPFADRYKEVMFTRHLPVLHSSLHPLKKNGSTLNYIDATTKSLLEAVIDLSAETYRQHATANTSRQRAKTLYDIYVKVIAYYKSLINEKLGGKPAILRKHCFGSRVHHSSRAVVVPQAVSLPMDHVLLPWKSIVNGLKSVILNFLMNRFRKNFNEAIRIFYGALVQYDELVDKCLKMYIDECPDHKGCIILGRNPTLAYGSIYQLFFDDFKRDPKDETISINACIVTSANIDFDGR